MSACPLKPASPWNGFRLKSGANLREYDIQMQRWMAWQIQYRLDVQRAALLARGRC